MKHLVIIMLVVVLAMLLAACAPAATPAPTQSPANGYSAQATNVPPAQATAPAAAATTPGAVAPAATPDIQKIVNVQPDDWKRGPDSAKVKIIEWGDFQ
jgi:hypothetical protein